MRGSHMLPARFVGRQNANNGQLGKSSMRKLLGLAAAVVICPSPAAAHEVFHLFTPYIDAGDWGAEALTTYQRPAADPQSAIAAHEFAVHSDITPFWMAKIAMGLERVDGGTYEFTEIALENVVRFTPPSHGPVDAAWFTGISAGISGSSTNSIEFGPVVSLVSGPATLILNPFFQKTFGRNAEDGMSFSYGWRATYELQERLSIGLEGFGEIADIAHAPALSDQIHRIGPVIYLGHVHGNPESHADGHDHEHGSEWHTEIGALFGLTSATPDAALKLNVGKDF
jgi:hypothetical protein